MEGGDVETTALVMSDDGVTGYGNTRAQSQQQVGMITASPLVQQQYHNSKAMKAATTAQQGHIGCYNSTARPCRLLQHHSKAM